MRPRKSPGRPYYIFYQYDPTMDENNKPINEKDKYEDNLIGLLTRKGSIFVRDFEPNRVLMFKKNSKMDFGYWFLMTGVSLWSTAHTLAEDDMDRKSYWLFTPEAGKVYCIMPIILRNTAVSKDEYFLNKESCEKLLRQAWGSGRDI